MQKRQIKQLQDAAVLLQSVAQETLRRTGNRAEAFATRDRKPFLDFQTAQRLQEITVELRTIGRQQ